MKTQQILNRSSKCANVSYHKNQVFLQFTIYSRPKLKKSSTLFLGHLPGKTKLATKFNKVSWLALLCVGDARNFQNSFFVKKYCFNLIFFPNTGCSSYKRERNLLKKDANHLKIAWHSKRQKKNIEKGERKTKTEKKSNNSTKSFFNFTFSYKKTYILLQNIFGKTYLLHLHYSYFTWQVIQNAVTKHQSPYRYALVL